MTRYDEVPYPGGCFPHTHPDHLCSQARLFGVDAPDPRTARILEIGCAHGANLIPLAWSLPEATIVGLDPAQVQIDQGRAEAERLGLTNLDLRVVDVSDWEPDGTYDYILCHGVYSWVPPHVQQAILNTIRSCMSETGVAYVSYNCLPGWHARMHLRDLMNFHATAWDDPQTQITQSRAILKMMADATRTNGTPYGVWNGHLADSLAKQWDAYIYHEYLSPHNEPLYLTQFVERLKDAGLQYLGDAEFKSMLASNFPDAVRDQLQVVSTDLVRGEVYMDFLRNRSFRKSLIVQPSQSPERSVNWERLRGVRVLGGFIAKEVVINDDSVGLFEMDEVPLSVDVPLIKAALLELAEQRPGSIGFEDLVTRARARLDPPSAATFEEDLDEVGTNLLACFAQGFVGVRTTQEPWANAVPERPRTSPIILHMLSKGLLVASLFHQHNNITDFDREILLLCDGSRDMSDLVTALTERMNAGAFTVKWEGDEPSETIDRERVVKLALEQRLEEMIKRGLLLR